MLDNHFIRIKCDNLDGIQQFRAFFKTARRLLLCLHFFCLDPRFLQTAFDG